MVLVGGASAVRAEVWFEDLGSPLELKTSDAAALVSLVQTLIHQLPLPEDFPSHLKDDRDPRIVLISASDGLRAANATVGTGQGIQAAVKAAVERAGLTRPPRFLRIDIVRNTRDPKLEWGGAPLGLLPGEGIATVSPSRGIAVLPDQILSRNLLTPQGRLRPGAYPGLDLETPLVFFTTEAFYVHAGQVFPVREDRWLNVDIPLDASELDHAITLAAGYLPRVVEPDGRFIYQLGDAAEEAADEYNIVRHAGTLYSMVQAYEYLGKSDEKLLAAIERAIPFMIKSIVPAEDFPDATILLEDDQVRLGANGLAILALAEYTRVTGDKQYLPAAQSLARWILATQSPAGWYEIHNQRFSDSAVLSRASLYYPGEAMFALCRLHDVAPDGPWLDSAERALRYLLSGKDPDINDVMILQDHWLLYAMENINARRPHPAYRDHTMKMIDAITSTQFESDPQNPDWAGAYTRPPNANQTATRVEGLAAACRLLIDAGESKSDHFKKARHSIERAIRFQLRQQFLPPHAMFHPDLAQRQGGFQNSPTDPRIRIDTVQHNLSALIDTRRLLFGSNQ